jgi:predicted phosphoadenosine phosphosulfate sulfurtransferase
MSRCRINDFVVDYKINTPTSSRTSGSGVGHVFESRPPALNWQQFHQFLLQRMTAKTAEDRLRYAKQYASVLQEEGSTVILLQLPPHKRIHIMKALSSLARYTGNQDTWRTIRQRYGLQWSTGTEKVDAFTRFF